MRDEELWVESYQGEVRGETLFATLAERQAEPGRKHQLEVLALLERATKELAEPVFARRGLDKGDTDATIADAKATVDGVAELSWDQFLGFFEPVTTQFLAKYRELADLVDGEEKAIALAYVDHEAALAAFARRALGQEDGDPLGPILTLPHVVAYTNG